MKTRAVMIGLVEDNKLFYLLDETEDGKDAAVVSKNGNVRYIDFFNFLSTNTTRTELKFSKFHQFLWSPKSDEEDRWKRIFINKTQKISTDMLTGVDIAQEIGKQKTKNALIDRGDLFRRYLGSARNDEASPLFMQRKGMPSPRSVIGYKALGSPLSMKPSVDGDGDGFVDDGLPTMRPFVPGFDFVLDAMGRAIQTPASSRSIRTGTNNRGVGTKVVLRRISEVQDEVERRFHSGKQIKTKSDAINALVSAIPSFDPKTRNPSTISFLERMDDSDELLPWQKSFISNFLFMIGSHPYRNDSRYRFKRQPRNTPSNILGGASPKVSKQNYRWDGERAIQVDPDDFTIDVTYQEPTSRNAAINFASSVLSATQDRGFNVLGVDVGDYAKELAGEYGLTNEFVKQYAEIIEINQHLAEINNLLRGSSQIPLEDMRRAAYVIKRANELLGNNFSEYGGRRIKSEVNRLLAEVVAGRSTDLAVLRRGLNQVLINADRVESDSKFIMRADKFKEATVEFSSVAAFSTGTHEATHIVQFLANNHFTMGKAREKKREFIAREAKSRGLSVKETTALEDDYPISAFIPDVIFDELRTMGENDIDALRARVMMMAAEPRGMPSYSSVGVGTAEILGIVTEQIGGLVSNLADPRFRSAQSLTQDEALMMAAEAAKFLRQPLFIGNEAIKITPDIERLLGDIEASLATGFEAVFGKKDAGEPLTVGMLGFLLGPSIIGRSTSSNLMSVRPTPASLRGIDASKNIMVALQTVGYPELDFMGQKIDGLNTEDAKLLADAIFANSAFISEVAEQFAAGRSSMPTLSNLRPRPNEVLLPFTFAPGGTPSGSPGTKDVSWEDFQAMGVDEIIDGLRGWYDFIVPQAIAEDSSTGDRNTWFLVDYPRVFLGEFSAFTPEEFKKLLEISGKVGEPTGRASTPAYTTYQATLLAGKGSFAPQLVHLLEFGAETILSELFGVPINQVDGSSGSKRALTNDELEIVYKYLAYLFPNGLPGDVLESLYA